jgi:plastocyanin domain-containing protein
LRAEKPFFVFTQRRPQRSGNARRQEEKMERKLIVTLIGIGLIVLVLWLSSGCSAV